MGEPIMARIAIAALAALALAGCSSFSDAFKPAPQTVAVKLESNPAGATATTSLGPGCTTPCEVTVPVTDSFTVDFTLDRFLPQTVPVQIIRQQGDFYSPASTRIDPNPVVAELTPAPAPKRARRSARKPASPPPAAGGAR
jgi:hypothetical protein